MRLKPLSEGCSVDLHDGGLCQSVGAHKLVVRWVERHADYADLARDAFRAPAEVAGIKAEGPVFGVAAASADEVDTFVADSGVGWLATFFECSMWEQLLD